MKKYLVSYWEERNDQATDLEIIIEAINFDEAYIKFRDIKRIAKIESIKLYNK